MKTYGKLSIDMRGRSLEFGDLAEAVATGGWTRDHSKEGVLRSGGGVWFVFALRGHQTLPHAFLSITQELGKATGIFFVPNVISPDRGQLSYDEYNQILESFVTSVLAPLKDQKAIDYDLNVMDIDFATLLPPPVYDRLCRFARTAKFMGITHPADRERWMDFLVMSDKENAELHSDTLARWLVEVEGWEKEQASRLAEEYGFGRELLQRRRRAS